MVYCFVCCCGFARCYSRHTQAKKKKRREQQTSKQAKQNKGKEKKRASERLVLFVCVGLCVAGTEFKNCAPRQKPKQSPVKNDSDTQSNRCFASMPKKEGEPDEECRLCGAIGVAKLMMFGTRGMRGKGGMSTAVGLSKAAIHSPDQAKEDYLLCVCVCVCEVRVSVTKRERKRERACVCVRVRVCVCVSEWERKREQGVATCCCCFQR